MLSDSQPQLRHMQAGHIWIYVAATSYLGPKLREACSSINGCLAVPALVQLFLPLLVCLRGCPCRLEEDLCAHRADKHVWIP